MTSFHSLLCKSAEVRSKDWGLGIHGGCSLGSPERAFASAKQIWFVFVRSNVVSICVSIQNSMFVETSLLVFQNDIFLRHYDKGPCRNKLGHSRASVMWNRTQVPWPLRKREIQWT